MIETLLGAGQLSFEAVLCLLVYGILLRVERMERDLSSIAEKARASENQMAGIAGEISEIKRRAHH